MRFLLLGLALSVSAHAVPFREVPLANNIGELVAATPDGEYVTMVKTQGGENSLIVFDGKTMLPRWETSKLRSDFFPQGQRGDFIRLQGAKAAYLPKENLIKFQVANDMRSPLEKWTIEIKVIKDATTKKDILLVIMSGSQYFSFRIPYLAEVDYVYSPDEDYIAFSFYNEAQNACEVHLWHLPSKKLIFKETAYGYCTRLRESPSINGRASGVVFSRDSKKLFTSFYGEAKAKLWILNGQQVTSHILDIGKIIAGGKFSPNGKYLLAANDIEDSVSEFGVWDTDSGQRLYQLRGASGKVPAAINNKGTMAMLATEMGDETTYLVFDFYDLAKGALESSVLENLWESSIRAEHLEDDTLILPHRNMGAGSANSLRFYDISF